MAAFNVIVAVPTLAAPAAALLERAGCRLHRLPGSTSPGALAELCRTLQADAILAGLSRIDAHVLDASARLRVVARHGTGTDNVDLQAAAERGIAVTRAPASNTRAVAEHAMALILALAKDLLPLKTGVAAGGWRDGVEATRDLAGCTLGLVGYGAVARAVDALASAFGMIVKRHHRSGGLPLAELLAQSAVLSLHCPSTPANYHMIGVEALAALPRGALVINTARGGLIDEAALLAALATGHVAGAGLDVFEREPPGLEDALRRHPRVIATPHMAGSTPGALAAVGVTAAECIIAVLAGRPVPADRLVLV